MSRRRRSLVGRNRPIGGTPRGPGDDSSTDEHGDELSITSTPEGVPEPEHAPDGDGQSLDEALDDVVDDLINDPALLDALVGADDLFPVAVPEAPVEDDAEAEVPVEDDAEPVAPVEDAPVEDDAEPVAPVEDAPVEDDAEPVAPVEDDVEARATADEDDVLDELAPEASPAPAPRSSDTGGDSLVSEGRPFVLEDDAEGGSASAHRPAYKATPTPPPTAARQAAPPAPKTDASPAKDPPPDTTDADMADLDMVDLDMADLDKMVLAQAQPVALDADDDNLLSRMLTPTGIMVGSSVLFVLLIAAMPIVWLSMNRDVQWKETKEASYRGISAQRGIRKDGPEMLGDVDPSLVEAPDQPPRPEPEPEPEPAPEPTEEVDDPAPPAPAPAPAPAATPAPAPAAAPAPAPKKPDAKGSTLVIRANRKALVYVNGAAVGYTPVDHAVQPGDYQVTALIPGQPESKQLKQATVAASGERISIQFGF